MKDASIYDQLWLQRFASPCNVGLYDEMYALFMNQNIYQKWVGVSEINFLKMVADVW